MVIDFHTHIFPDKIAQAALPKLSKASGGGEPCGLATVSSMTDVMKNSGVDKAVFLSIATNPKQQKNVNDFAIAQLDNPYLIPFGSVHPDSEEALDELERLNGEGTTIMLVTHDARVAARCSRVLFIVDGNIKDEYNKDKKATLRDNERNLNNWLLEMGF